MFELGWDLLRLGTHPSHGKLFLQRAGVVTGLFFPVCYTLQLYGVLVPGGERCGVPACTKR